MKKTLAILVALMLAASTLAYAGGDQNCGSTGTGPNGSNGGGDVSQNRAAAD
jgi:hypothetical protein